MVTEVLVMKINVVWGLFMGVYFAGGSGFVPVCVVEGDGGGFEECAVLGV
jgi:hypothetical protein